MKIRFLRVGVASCGIAAGADKVFEKLKEKAGDIPVIGVGCLGHCYAEPVVEAVTDSGESMSSFTALAARLPWKVPKARL